MKTIDTRHIGDTATPTGGATTMPGMVPGPARARALRARCADGNGTLTPLFFSDDPVDTARAKAICRPCQLRADCLERALDRGEPWGVWGGELIDTGRVVTVRRPRGRPPKVARPPLVVDELLTPLDRTTLRPMPAVTRTATPSAVTSGRVA